MTPLLPCHYQRRYGRLFVGTAVRCARVISRATGALSHNKDAPELLPGARGSGVVGQGKRIAARSFSTAQSSLLPTTSNAFVLLKLYNSLSGIKEPIVMVDDDSPQKITLGIACYTCGPTVYAPSHLGHARTYVWLDILRRTLQQATHQQSETASHQPPPPPPLFVMNITDVDDKILAAAAAAASVNTDSSISSSSSSNHTHLSSPLDLARHYEAEFWNDWDALHCLRPHVVMRVSEHVESDIVPYIQRLMDQGVAYEMIHCNSNVGRSAMDENHDDDESEGGVYFDTQAYEQLCSVDYGNCFRSKRDENSNKEINKHGDITTREETHEQAFSTPIPQSKEYTNRKRSPRDFALWKHRKRGEALYWASPWGAGRPGWHIECSAMLDSARRQFQNTHTFALHAGGVDLQFPHHTNEIAQAEAYRHSHASTGAATSSTSNINCCGNSNNNHDGRWIPHWIHTGHLKIDGLKMSKSLKNFISIQDWLDQAAANVGGTHNPRAAAADDFRLWCLGLSGSYRKTATFSYQRLEEAHNVRAKLVQFLIQGEEWLIVQNQRRTTKRGSRHRDIKKYRPRDHALLTKVHEAAALGRRAMVEMDLDGTTFVKQLVVIAEAGMAHLRQNDNDDAEHGPTEPVQASLDVLRDMLQQVGFSDTTYRAGITASDGQSQETVASRDGGDQHNSMNRAVLDELTRFRSMVRRAAMDDLQQNPVIPGNVAGSCGLNQRILTSCDELRNNLSSLGVVLLDASVAAGKNGCKDDWRFSVPRASHLSSESADNASSLTQYDTNVSQATPTFQKRMLTPQNIFRLDPRYEGMFSEFDQNGIPTRHADGSEVSKSQQKKYRKKQAKHAQLLESKDE